MTAANLVWCPPLPPVSSGGIACPRIGMAGIGIESSTFSPHRTTLEDFTLLRGDGLLAFYPFTTTYDANWVPILRARSLPGGAVERATYEALRDEILAGAAAQGPFDGFYLDLHGAMSVEGMDDAEADLAEKLRDVLGPDTLVGAPMDLHGNVSPRLLRAVDLLTCYRMAPHEDEANTRERAAWTLLSRLRGPYGTDPAARRPFLAWVPVPVLLPGEKTSTRIEPAKGLYERVARVADLDGVLDAALWVGYAWADEPRCHAAVVVSGDDADLVAAEATGIAQAFWQARDSFVFVADTMPLADAVDRAVATVADTGERPYVISDSGDNPTAGGAGDVTWTLARLLDDSRFTGGGLTVVHASTQDAEVAPRLAAAGLGAQVDAYVGARVDDRHSPPVRVRGVVTGVGYSEPGGHLVVVRAGGVSVVLTERRRPFHHVADFTQLGIDVHATDVLVVKIGYLEPELYDLARGWTMALTPGGVDQELLRLGHHRLLPGTHPFDPNGPPPTLEALVVRRS